LYQLIKIFNRIIALRVFIIAIFFKKKNNVIFLTEHLGDIIAAAPIAKEIFLKTNLQTYWVVEKKYSKIFHFIPYIKVIKVRNLGEAILLEQFLLKLKKSVKTYNLNFNGRRCEKTGLININVHNQITWDNYYDYGTLLDVFSALGGVTLSIKSQLIFESNKGIKEDAYIILHTSSNEDIRNCNNLFWNTLAQYLIENTNFKIYEIGFKSNININNRNLINYCGIKDLKEIGKLISGCTFFIGLDSGFAHLANAFEIESIIILNKKYKNFDKYMPFNGFFNLNKEKQIFIVDETQKINFEQIQDFLLKKLNRLGISNKVI
jgi:heptosyltransferase-3